MIRLFLPLGCCLLVAGSVSAGEQARPNTLTPDEVREGWILLFDGQTTYGWQIDGEVTVKEGTLNLGGQKKTVAEFTTPFEHFQIQFEHQGEQNQNKVNFSQEGKPVLIHGAFLQPVKEWRGESFTLHPDHPDFDGVKKISFEVPAGSTLRLRSIKLKPLGTRSLFNGKDLSGWKEHPGKKSRFTVTPEGYLNVKDGPGDLQTEKKFKDFVLQLECISHGKHLNSGIFFRCIPDQYQQGYEVQVRNEFTPGQKRTYKLDKFDPKTHQKVGTVEVESEAVDFGTGAIYRRLPARKQASRDGEWFTLTLAAHGNHFATWVNGIQVADWTDHRPLSDNARQGCCLNAGTISIQGHDPTTDLSFRNLRIAEFPAP